MEKDITAAIRTVRKKVSREEWRERILECRSSGMSVQKWCGKRESSPGSDYAHLRKIREEILEEQRLVRKRQAPRRLKSLHLRA